MTNWRPSGRMWPIWIIFAGRENSEQTLNTALSLHMGSMNVRLDQMNISIKKFQWVTRVSFVERLSAFATSRKLSVIMKHNQKVKIWNVITKRETDKLRELK
jgi:hypothetical protein